MVLDTPPGLDSVASISLILHWGNHVEAEIARHRLQFNGEETAAVVLVGSPVLSVDDELGIATLETIDEAKERYFDCYRSCRPLVQMGLSVKLEQFIALVHEEGITDSSFSTPDLGKIAGVSPVCIHYWWEDKILVPDGLRSTRKERRASFSTAFATSICGTIRKAGVGVAGMRAVANLIRKVGLPQPERRKKVRA
jgi:hypothetical protein